MAKIAVIGGGAWGSSIANLLGSNGNEVLLWCFEEELVAQINNDHENKLYFPGIKLSENIRAVNDFADFTEIEALFSVVPAQFTAKILAPLSEQGILNKEVPIIICSKGIENQSHKLLSDILAELFPDNPLAAMSGPNFADEIAKESPAITSIACSNREVAENIAALVKNNNFKPYICDDIIGAELSGAIKNVIAIAMGVAEGLGLSQSSKASIITKGINEIAMLSESLGGKKETMVEPCGIGDLVLTCSSQKSRNMSLGYALGKGRKLADIVKNRNSVAEGVATCKAAKELGDKLALKLDMINLVYKILYENISISEPDFFS